MYTHVQVWFLFLFVFIVFALFLLNINLADHGVILSSVKSSLAYQIEGNVKYPGFYSYTDDISISEALNRAGGMEKFVLLSPGILSLPVFNASRITIDTSIKIEPIEAEKFILFGIPLDINVMNEEQLKAVPGIGEKLAKNIISYRNTFGCFKSLEEIKNISGIGKGNYKTIKHYFSIHGKGDLNGS